MDNDSDSDEFTEADLVGELAAWRDYIGEGEKPAGFYTIPELRDRLRIPENTLRRKIYDGVTAGRVECRTWQRGGKVVKVYRLRGEE